MSSVKNRPEIDGLRAVAVLPVVLYHASVGFPGGYVGVDVFFVISGFLITSLILSEVDKDSFRIANFWERRVRRILPALLLVVLACLVAGWFMFIPSDFDELGRSVAYQSLLISNVYFWKTTDYFTSTDTQPLLHTWSLAVEEQYYLLFPLALAALVRFSRRWAIAVLLVAAALSLTVSVYGGYAFPTAAFYLLPSRAWELLVGAVLALAPDFWQPGRWWREILGWAGLLGILLAATEYDRETRFPGTAALLPCLGAGLVVWANSPQRTSLGRVLSLRPVVFVGLISYSLYLWHWPLLIFSNYLDQGEPSLARNLAIVGVSVVLAAVTWKLVETPFRKRVALPRRAHVFAFAGLALGVLLVTGRLIHKAGGVRARWRPDALRYVDERNDKDFRVELDLASAKSGDFTPIGYTGTDRPVDLLVWGDSHAMAILHVLNVMCARQGVRAVAATHSATAPLLDFPCSTRFSLKEDSIPYNWAIANFVQKKQIKRVLLVAAWNAYLLAAPSFDAKDGFRESLKRTVAVLHRAGARVYIMLDVPKQPFDVPRLLATDAEYRLDPSKLGVPFAQYLARNGAVNELLSQAVSDPTALLDPTAALTDKAGICRAELNGNSLYFDQHHLTIYGEMLLQPMFAPLFRSIGTGN